MELEKVSPFKPVFPCGDNWFELRSPRPRLGVPSSAYHVPHPLSHTHPCAEAQQQVHYVHFSKIQLIGKRYLTCACFYKVEKWKMNP